VVHYRESLALVIETGQHLGRIHSEFHNLKSHTSVNRLELLGQVHGAHTPFAYRSKDPITAEVVVTGSRCRSNGLSGGIFHADRTIEGAQDQTLRAQSGGIIGARLLSALRTVWHLDQSRRNLFYALLPGRCNLQRRDSLFVSGEPDPTGSLIEF
jgi:hypothetical protein